MDLDAFRKSLDEDQPPAGVGRALQALWWEARDDWDQAHRLAQAETGPDGAWVHAYLHRKEGDLSNAQFWYSRAGRAMPEVSLDAEWADIADALLGAG